MEEKRFPIPPFTLETALQKVQSAEDAWNTRDPEKVALAYSIDTEWRNRTEFINGREEVKAFLYRKWKKNSATGLKKNSGVSAKTGWPCVSSTNGMIIPGSGFEATAMNSGSLTITD